MGYQVHCCSPDVLVIRHDRSSMSPDVGTPFYGKVDVRLVLKKGGEGSVENAQKYLASSSKDRAGGRPRRGESGILRIAHFGRGRGGPIFRVPHQESNYSEREFSRIRRASWMSLGMMVTRLAWIAHVGVLEEAHQRVSGLLGSEHSRLLKPGRVTGQHLDGVRTPHLSSMDRI